ncbi:hypothetical protein NKH77_24420 [Streptomyces sp. M19]
MADPDTATDPDTVRVLTAVHHRAAVRTGPADLDLALGAPYAEARPSARRPVTRGGRWPRAAYRLRPAGAARRARPRERARASPPPGRPPRGGPCEAVIRRPRHPTPPVRSSRP